MKYLLLLFILLLPFCGKSRDEVYRLNPYSGQCKHIKHEYSHYILYLNDANCHLVYTYDYEDYYYVCKDINGEDWFYYKDIESCKS